MDFVEETVFSPLPASASTPESDPFSFDFLEQPSGSESASLSSANPLTGNMNEPKLGGTFKDEVVWIGGPPKDDWSGPSFDSPATPLCLRNLDASSEIKGCTKRTAGLVDLKFKRDDSNFSLIAFADAALQHMQQTGMDTVFHMTGVDANGEGAEELFTFHTRFTKQAVIDHVQSKIDDGSFDKHQVDALSQSALWLANSLDESLKSSLRTQIAARPSGPVLWMAIVGEVQANTLDRCDKLADAFKALTLSQFKGENVRDHAASAEEMLTQLERDNQLPRNHLKTIVDAFCVCTVDDFKIHWMSRRHAVDVFIKDSAGKDEKVVKQLSNFVHWSDLLEEGKEKFLGLQKQWGPAKDGGPNTAAMLSKLSAQVASLNQQLKAKSPASNGSGNGNGNGSNQNKELKCFKCGKPGFTKKTCPDCNPNRDASNNNGNNNSGGGNGNSSGGKWAAPKDGEPTQKTVNGVLFKWCQKCRGGKGHWNKTHSTDEHKENFFKDKKKEDGEPSAKLASCDQELHVSWAG